MVTPLLSVSRVTCRLDLSDRPRLAYQLKQTRHTTRETAIFYPAVENLSLGEIARAEGGRLIVHEREKNKEADSLSSNLTPAEHWTLGRGQKN